MRIHLPLLLLSLFAFEQLCAAPPILPEEPKVAAASGEAALAMKSIRLAEGLQVRLFAAEPLVANPVSFCLDKHGRLYVIESFRQNRGVTDNRGHDQKWLDDDLAAQSVADRIAYHRKHLGEKAREYTRHDDRIRRIIDSDGDGVADKANVFAKHFNNLEDGSGAGVLVHGPNLLYTCIPHLWQLRDEDGDGVADQRTSLHYGYGVRVAFRGHDLHGMVIGPTGKLYYSIGDRGYNIEFEGRRFKDPASGAIFRCNPDGSELEVFATGLRNPQELAFDDLGNLFTGDNNSDSGDRARWVYLVRGGDTGWRMNYQYLPDRGPFNREKIWHPYHEETPAYIVPPVTNLADGPSGLAYYPGTGLDPSFRGRFLLCDFRGAPGRSGIRTFRVSANGAFFKVVDQEEPIWKVLATDLAFGPRGGLYISDWVDGWNGEGKGRIYTVESADKEMRQDAEATGTLIQQDWAELSERQLIAHLTHRDRRVRQAAQFELATRDAIPLIRETLSRSSQLLQKVHLVWALQQMARDGGEKRSEAAITVLRGQLDSVDEEIRSQVARSLGELRALSSEAALIEQLDDENLRVRHMAAISLGQLGSSAAAPALIAMLAENSDQDPILRHSGIMGLVGGENSAAVLDAMTHPSASIRKAIAVVLRRWHSDEIGQLLDDSDPLVVLEAARAIHDLPIDGALAELADLIHRPGMADATIRRVLNANLRLGKATHANLVAAYATRESEPVGMRIEALELLASWSQPASRDRVLGDWRPIASRDPQIAIAALKNHLPALLSATSRVATRTTEIATDLGIREIEETLRATLANREASGPERAASLTALGRVNVGQLAQIVEPLLADNSAEVRAAARHQLAGYDPEAALRILTRPTMLPTQVERQQAMQTLATVESPQVDNILLDAINRLYFPDQVPADMRLDVQQAASQRKNEQVQSALRFYRDSRRGPLGALIDCLEGGNPERGREIFLYRTEVSCVRCHKASGQGGEVGPALDGIGSSKDRKYLLESILVPNAAIARGFQSAALVDLDGRVLTGVVRAEDDEQIELVSSEGRRTILRKDQIELRKEAKSPMPEDLAKRLSPTDIRDLVAYLASLRKAPSQP